MSIWTFDEILEENLLNISKIGGKASNLVRIAKFNVPNGLIVSTDALSDFYQQKIDESTTLESFVLKQLGNLNTLSSIDHIRQIGSTIRDRMESMSIESTQFMDTFSNKFKKFTKDRDIHLAVRSSGIEEDDVDFSFAGQHDTYLNLVPDAEIILKHIVKCWDSLYSDRALAYRLSHMKDGIGDQVLYMGVVVQEMVSEISSSGIMFTADPVTNDRSIVVIDCSYGMGEALVSGLCTPDSYKVHKKTLQIVEKNIQNKTTMLTTTKNGATKKVIVPIELKKKQTLSDEHIIALARVGKDIETLYGKEQDVEFSFDAHGRLHILQTRPITTLFPIPTPIRSSCSSERSQIFVSFGHIQVMTDPIKHLGQDVIKSLLGGVTTMSSPDLPSIEHRIAFAAGHPYINFSDIWNSPFGKIWSEHMDIVDGWIKKGVQNAINRSEFKENAPRLSWTNYVNMIWTIFIFIASIVIGFVTCSSKKPGKVLEEVRNQISDTSMDDLSSIGKFFRHLVGSFVVFLPIMMLGMKFLVYFLGKESLDRIVSDVKLKTTQMNEELHMLGKMAHQDDKLINLLETLKMPLNASEFIKILNENSFNEFSRVFSKFMDEYGCRGVSEIDITRDRFHENVEFPISVILQPVTESSDKKHTTVEEMLKNIQIRDQTSCWNLISFGLTGKIKIWIIGALVYKFKQVFAYREHPKHLIMMYLWKQKLNILEIGKKHFKDPKDVFYLSLEEINRIYEVKSLDSLIESRKKEFISWKKFKTIPRVMMNTGEHVDLAIYREELKKYPPNTMIGTGVSSGVIEGRANIILDPITTSPRDGDIIVAQQIDPTFSALFIHCVGIVSEVGGLMTHGSVVAREMQIPCVVGIIDATIKIKQGDRIRVNGTLGIVEMI